MNYKYKYTKYKYKYLNRDNNKKNHDTYYIHDNGGRPFKVVVKYNQAKIYRQNYNVLDDNDYDDNRDQVASWETFPILIFEFREVFIGKSPAIKMTKFSGGIGEEFDGNSILLYLGDNLYVCVGGMEIFSFRSLSKITEFVSPVGNSDVPYPYAIDDHGNYYLLIEDVVIKNNPSITHQMNDYTLNDDDPYSYYYDYHLITSDMSRIPPQLPKLPYFLDIESYYIGQDRYTLRYKPFPEKEYDRLVKSFGNNMYIVTKYGKKKIKLDKAKYVELMKSFGLAQSFEPIMSKVVHHPRHE
jgi:glutaredoxin-related protein